VIYIDIYIYIYYQSLVGNDSEKSVATNEKWALHETGERCFLLGPCPEVIVGSIVACFNIRKVLRPAYSITVFRGFPWSQSEC
jgi:hypothetical protein